MRWPSAAALLIVATSLAATAQNRSDAPARTYIPVSPGGMSWQAPAAPPVVNAQSPQRTYIPVPPATTSPGFSLFAPAGFPPQCNSVGPLIPSAMGCTDPRFTGGIINLRPHFHRSYSIYAPYGYPVYVESQPQPQQVVEEPEPPAPTIFERRPIAAPLRPASAAAESRPHSLQQSGSAAEHEQVPTILIFRDGHQTEVLNYAIVGQTLYDLGTFVAHKIPLSDLNLKATIKANAERGVEFSVPASTKVD